MKIIFKSSLFLLIAFILPLTIFAQNNFFSDEGQNRMMQASGLRVIIPEKFRSSQLNVMAIKNFLWSLPVEKKLVNKSQAPIITLPMPNGEMAKFSVWESSVQEPGLEAKFPEIKTFTGQGIDDPYATIRLDMGPNGFHAQVLTVNGSFYIDPYAKGSIDKYISYYRNDLKKSGSWVCEIPENPGQYRTENPQASCLGTNLKTYRLAVACTGEYAQAPGINAGTNPAILHAAIVTSVNRVVGVYEKEVSIRMVLVATNNLVEFLDAATDPFTGNNNASTLINESQTVIDANIGSANYDIGHTFSTGGGGLAQLRCPCGPSKARGITGSSNPTGDGYDIDYVAHEMGHQFGGNHSFNGQVSNCSGGNRNGSTAYEPGSGTTIMSYAGICGSDNLQPNSDPYFHAISFDEISDFVLTGGGNSCGSSAPTGNNLPVIGALQNNGATIPVSTPFTLTGSATDADGDALTYSWEQWDLGPQGAWNSGATSTTAPNFKSRIPKVSGSRTFPDIAVILAGYPSNPAATMGGLKGETLPSVARAMKFKLTVRDNRAGGGGVVSSGSSGCQTSSSFQVNVAGSTPFTITSLNGGENINSGSTQNITWNTAGTEAAPFNVANVKFSLSTAGGNTYPVQLLASTANDGSESVVFPCLTSPTARIKIEAIGNIFFDISNGNFSIQSGFDFNSPAQTISSCPVPVSLSVSLGTITFCGFSNPINLGASGNPAGTTVTFSTNPVTPGSNVTVTLNGTNTLAPGTYVVTITGAASGASVKLRDLSFVISTTTIPIISGNPIGQTLCSGSNATFNVTASDASSYQWQINTGSGFTDITGANSASYTANGITPGMNGNQYRVIAISTCAISTTSSSATLTVISPVSISGAGQPASSVLCSGNNTNFAVTGNSTQTIIYQWQENRGSGFTDVINGGVYSGATTATLVITGATDGMSGYQFRCQLSNATCSVPTNSNTALLTVRPLPIITLNAQPLISLLPGQITTLTAVPAGSSGNNLTTSWLYNGATPSPNITGNSYVVNVEHAGTYQVQVQETFSSPTLICSNQTPVLTIAATESKKLFIFPSPNDGNFTVSYYNNGGTSTQRTIIIYDSRGSQVYNRKFPITGAYTLIPIKLENVNRGIFFVVVGDLNGKKLAEGKVHIR